VNALSVFVSRYAVSKSERRKLVERLSAGLPPAAGLIERAGLVEVARLRGSESELVLVDGVAALVLEKELAYPTLLAAHKLGLELPRVTVDMGAVPHILNGADVMVPGIVAFSEFEAGSVVYVDDVEKRRVFAVGLALIGSNELRNVKRGKAVRTLHYAGDKLWKLLTGAR
jgi:PUA domain protein